MNKYIFKCQKVGCNSNSRNCKIIVEKDYIPDYPRCPYDFSRQKFKRITGIKNNFINKIFNNEILCNLLKINIKGE